MAFKLMMPAQARGLLLRKWHGYRLYPHGAPEIFTTDLGSRFPSFDVIKVRMVARESMLSMPLSDAGYPLPFIDSKSGWRTTSAFSVQCSAFVAEHHM